MSHNIYIYILVMAGVSYLIRMLPLTLIRKEIKNKTIRSFLYYVPYVTLAVMNLPGNPVRDRKCLVCMGSSDRCHSTCMVWEKPAASIRMRMHGGVPVRIVFVKWKNYIKLKQKKSCSMTRVKFYGLAAPLIYILSM